MAISHAQPLLLLVLVSLFFFPTMSQEFRNCDPLYKYDVEVSDLKISPYPVKFNETIKFKITGNTSKVIADGATVKFKLQSTMNSESKLSTYSLCNVTKCPVAAGPFELTFSDVVPSSFGGYVVLATLYIPKKTLGEYVMCILFAIRTDKIVISQVTE